LNFEQFLSFFMQVSNECFLNNNEINSQNKFKYFLSHIKDNAKREYGVNIITEI
jgi:hypothetical protein